MKNGTSKVDSTQVEITPPVYLSIDIQHTTHNKLQIANIKSSAAQAIKDMQELGINVSFLMGSIAEIHVLNAEISIVTKKRVKKQRKEQPVKRFVPKPAPKPRHVYNRNIVINIDGTVSVSFTEWDYK